MALWRFAYRHAATRPGRSALALLSIVIAVAAVSSVAIAVSTTRTAYREMFNTLSGPAGLEISAEGGGGFDAKVLDDVKQIPGVKMAVPVLQRPSIMYVKNRRVQTLVLGVDPKQYRNFRGYSIRSGRDLDGGSGMLIESQFADRMGLRDGSEVRLLTRRGLKSTSVVGLFALEGTGALRAGGMVFLPLEQAQLLFAARDKLDAIQIVLAQDAKSEEVQKLVQSRLPSGLAVQPPATHTRLAEETLAASEQGLLLASEFSLLLATFIILNTFLMNVGERRRTLAILRAIGATRSQIGKLLFTESLVLGVLGTFLGLLVGIGGAYLLTTTLDKILMASLPPMVVTAIPLIIAALCGLGVSMVGAAFPAYRATQLSPRESMAGASREEAERAPRKTLIWGILIAVISTGCLLACINGLLPVELAVTAAAALLVGIVLLTVVVLGQLSRSVVWCLSPVLKVEARLAQRQLMRHRLRSTLTIGVLFLGSATGVGLASAILDNVRDLRNWYERAIVGDFFVRAMMPDMATGMSADLPEAMGREIREVPGIASLDTFRLVRARSDGLTVIVVTRGFNTGNKFFFDLKQGDAGTIREKLYNGEVVIGSVLAQRSGRKLGDTISLETLQGPKELKIAGITNEYLVGGLTLYMERGLAEKLLHVEGVDAYIIQADPQRLAEVENRLLDLCNKHGVLLHSFADIRRLIEGMVAGVDGCLWGILALGFIVASFGVVNTLTMNVLEQTRELGLLRIVAMTRWQVRRTIFSQALIIGIIGVFPGLAAGVGVAYLISLATAPVIGHAIEFGHHPLMLICCGLGGMAIVIISAIFPIERAARLDVAKALQYE